MLNPAVENRCTIQHAHVEAERMLRALEGAHAHAAASAAAEKASGLALKFVAPNIQLGKAADALHGLPKLLGYPDAATFYPKDIVSAMAAEFDKSGREVDKQNFAGIMNGTYRNPVSTSTAAAAATATAMAGVGGGAAAAAAVAAAAAAATKTTDESRKCKTIDEVMDSPEVRTADLKRHHVIALMLYTTSSYAAINEPLRQDPVQKPHPFAVTVFYISEAIKKLRLNAINAKFPKTYWRGLKDRKLSKDFFNASGGTEFGCMSTSALKSIAFDFAKSKCPLVFKLVVTGALTDGADISFLSVYPQEKEVLYPPLTFLRVNKRQPYVDIVGTNTMLVIEVEPQYPS